MYKVYMHVTPNGKKYIGITSASLKRRWGNGQGYKSQLFNRAIEKYGWSNIEHVLLYDNLTAEEAKKKEIELIAKYKTTDRKYGYNKSNGGDTRMSPPLKVRLKQSKVQQKISRKKRYDYSSIELRHREGKPVVCVETGVIFPRIKDASEFYQICDETIRKCCHKERFTAGGYHWEFYEEGTM